MGIIVSLFFFGDREIDFSYLPNARTLKYLRNQNFSILPSLKCHLDCVGMDFNDFKQLFNEANLQVDFQASEIQRRCPKYFIKVEDQSFSSFVISDCDSLSTLISIEGVYCHCP
tara:strand:+ start:392 stop:733 length:342 start_codon:yes stop_codon:yes gene_type:complete